MATRQHEGSRFVPTGTTQVGEGPVNRSGPNVRKDAQCTLDHPPCASQLCWVPHIQHTCAFVSQEASTSCKARTSEPQRKRHKARGQDLASWLKRHASARSTRRRRRSLRSLRGLLAKISWADSAPNFCCKRPPQEGWNASSGGLKPACTMPKKRRAKLAVAPKKSKRIVDP